MYKNPVSLWTVIRRLSTQKCSSHKLQGCHPQRSKKVASWASVYTDAPLHQTRPPARFVKPACSGHPQFPYDCQLCCQAERRFTPLVTITYNKKTGQGRSGIHPFLPCPLITTVTVLSSAVWQLPVPFADHRYRTAPRSVWASEPIEPRKNEVISVLGQSNTFKEAFH